MPACSNFACTLSSLGVLKDDASSPLRARPAPPSSPRKQENPAPGGQLTPWKRVTSSSSSASTTCRYVQPSPCMSLARSAPFGAHMLLTSQSSPLDCPCPCAQDVDWLRRLLSQEVCMGARGVGATARGAGSAALVRRWSVRAAHAPFARLAARFVRPFASISSVPIEIIPMPTELDLPSL
jgi:hypothetical protein